MRLLALLLAFLATPGLAHEMTPTYPKLGLSFTKSILFTELSLFNAREDVQFYKIDVFTEDWQPVEFVTQYKVLKVPYNARRNFKVYIKSSAEAVYVCSTSKHRRGWTSQTVVTSKVCSKLARR